MTRKQICLAALVLFALVAIPVPFAHARYYHPTLGRWITRDPAESELNLYGYCGSSPAQRVDRYGGTWSTFWTIGEECVFTGEYRIETDDDTVQLSGDPLDWVFGDTSVTLTFYYCQCKIHCCDYDLSQPYGWVLDAEWDDWVNEGDRYEKSKTFEDARKLYARAGQAVGEALGRLTNPGRDEGTGSRLSDDFADVLGKVAEIQAEKQFDLWNSEESWEREKQARVEAYTRKCESACKAKSGQSH
jgi:hypothetical protein